MAEARSAARTGSRTIPFARDEPRYRNELRILSTEQGLAAAFVIDQPPQERRIKPRTPRESERLTGDTVSLIVDFDANAQIGYEFTVAPRRRHARRLITNQNKFDRDWDGELAARGARERRAVVRRDPDSLVQHQHARVGRRHAHDRHVRARAICSSAASATPARASPAKPRCFFPTSGAFQISQHDAGRQLRLRAVRRPCISDFVDDHTRFKAGADINWKISPNLWLAATLNPDFGQVESDELVVDFSAIETVFTDKRPFFTENQGIFDLRTPANGQLIYTRRIGAAPTMASAPVRPTSTPR